MSNSLSSDDEIQEIKQTAYKVYQNRQLLGRQGDSQGDWRTSEKIVQSPWRSFLFTGNCHLIKPIKPITQVLKFVARDIPRWFLFSLPQLDWVKLLAVPLVLAAAGSIVTGQFQRESNQNAVLKAYFDKLETLSFDHKLLEKKPDAGAIVLARGRTVAALRELDLRRRIQLIAFLQASGLLRLDETKKQTEPIISFNDQNLSELDLRRTDLSLAHFSDANLSGTDIRDAYLVGTNLSDADLSDANLSDANLSDADLSDANLRDADLSDANLSDADIRRADFSGDNLIGARLDEIIPAEPSPNRTSLNGADLSGADLSGADLSGVSLIGADLKYADLNNTYLFGARLNGASLFGADLSDATLSRADLSNVDLQYADLSGADLRGAIYNNQTILPEGFAPELEGMVKVIL